MNVNYGAKLAFANSQALEMHCIRFRDRWMRVLWVPAWSPPLPAPVDGIDLDTEEYVLRELWQARSGAPL